METFLKYSNYKGQTITNQNGQRFIDIIKIIKLDEQNKILNNNFILCYNESYLNKIIIQKRKRNTSRINKFCP